MVHFVRDDGQRQPVFGVRYEVWHPFVGHSDGDTGCPLAFPQRVDASMRERRRGRTRSFTVSCGSHGREGPTVVRKPYRRRLARLFQNRACNSAAVRTIDRNLVVVGASIWSVTIRGFDALDSRCRRVEYCSTDSRSPS